jgi:hypothetical protein
MSKVQTVCSWITLEMRTECVWKKGVISNEVNGKFDISEFYIKQIKEGMDGMLMCGYIILNVPFQYQQLMQFSLFFQNKQEYQEIHLEI